MANVILINFNLLEFEPLAEYHALHAYVEKRYIEGCRNVVMIDEVQMRKGFEQAINGLHASEKYDIHIWRTIRFATQSLVRKARFGHVYENMVAIELMRRGWEVYVGVLYQKEVDFVAIMRDCRVYIQVSDDISQEATLERELDPLRRIRDAYPKCIIARTGHETTDWDGIKVIDLARWLMGESDGLTF